MKFSNAPNKGNHNCSVKARCKKTAIKKLQVYKTPDDYIPFVDTQV